MKTPCPTPGLEASAWSPTPGAVGRRSLAGSALLSYTRPRDHNLSNRAPNTVCAIGSRGNRLWVVASHVTKRSTEVGRASPSSAIGSNPS